MANEEAKTKPEKRGKKFGFYFAIATSLLIAAAIIFTTFYSMRCITYLMKDYKETTIAYNNFSGLQTFRHHPTTISKLFCHIFD